MCVCVFIYMLLSFANWTIFMYVYMPFVTCLLYLMCKYVFFLSVVYCIILLTTKA